MKINYDVTIPEMQTAFMQFWAKYSLKRTIMFSIVFMIAIFISITMIINNQGIIAWILMGLAAGFLANLWLKPRRACKRLVMVLNTMYEEKYSAVFGDSAIEIETIVHSEETEEVDKSEYALASEELYSKETRDLFLLFVNRALVYTFPKRCLTKKEAEDLRTYFIEKRI